MKKDQSFINMKAIVCKQYGGPGVLQLVNMPRPVPGDKEILIRVHASTVSAAAIHIRNGFFPGSALFTLLLRLQFGIRGPVNPVLGAEFSGVVQAVGKDVRLYKAGDEVYGTTTGLKQGAYADYLCVPEKWQQGLITIKPQTLSFEMAAALPVGGITALQLLQKAGIGAGKTVLVYGASGSVGTYAVQIARYYGAHVTAVCSAANRQLVMSIGADVFLDYTAGDIEACKQKFDIVMDAVAKVPASRLKPLLNKQGVFVSVRAITREKMSYLQLLHQMIEEEKLLPVIDRVYPFDQLVAAHTYVDQGHKKGNVVIKHI